MLTGLTKAEAKAQYPDQVALLADVHAAVSGAEPYDQFKDRITGALRELAAAKIETIAVITQGGPIRLIYRELLKLGEIDIADCGWCLLQVSNSNYKLLAQKRIQAQRAN